MQSFLLADCEYQVLQDSTRMLYEPEYDDKGYKGAGSEYTNALTDLPAVRSLGANPTSTVRTNLNLHVLSYVEHVKVTVHTSYFDAGHYTSTLFVSVALVKVNLYRPPTSSRYVMKL